MKYGSCERKKNGYLNKVWKLRKKWQSLRRSMEVRIKKIMGSEWRFKELSWSMEVVKEKWWVFERSLEDENKITASKTKYGSSNKKKSWVLSKNKELLRSMEVVKEKRWVFERSLEVKKKIAFKTKYGSSNKKNHGFWIRI